MSKISKDGYDQIQVIKSALDSMYDKLSSGDLYLKSRGKVKNVEDAYKATNATALVQDELETIAGIIAETQTWEEVSETEEV